MSRLFDFAANEVGWEAVLSRLERAVSDFQKRAATADTHDEHLDLRGKMYGVAHALTLIDAARAEFKQ